MAIYFDLVIRCPACIAQGKDGGYPSQWYHANCGGKLQIGDDAYLKCFTCRKRKYIRYWPYACETYEATCDTHETTYKYTTSPHFMTVFTTAVQVANLKWLLTLLNNVGDW